MRLADLDVLVIDCQTTGATPALGDLLEVGWTIARPTGAFEPVRAHRVALPEGKRIPRIVAKLTGLETEEGREGVAPDAIWSNLRHLAQRLSKAARPAPTVIHFARFELVFLKHLHACYDDGSPFPFDVICAHDIARRLFPDLPRRGLRALAGYFGHTLELERRSASHTAATARVWRDLVGELAKNDVRDWSDLRAWLAEPAPPPSRRRAFPMPREERRALPSGPGVYRMLRSNGDILYVGKAASLRQRVAGHFTQGKTSERALEMLTQVRDIAVTETPTALEAALLEADEIKRHAPPYNVQLTNDRCAWFVAPDFSAFAEAPASPRWLGPLPSKWSLAAFAAVRALALGIEPHGSFLGRSVGVHPSAGPAEEAYVLGWASFVERHITPMRSRTWWGRFIKASKVLLRMLGEGALEEGDGNGPWAWDPDRIRRHLERSVLQGGQLVRRARFLTIATHCAIAFREARSERRRLLVVSEGEIGPIRDLETNEPITQPVAPSWMARLSCFDGARYDRLRVLTTELKRVLAEGGEAEMRLGERAIIPPTKLAKVFAAI